MGIKLISPFKKVLCPYCDNEFHLSETTYRDVTDDPSGRVPAPEILNVFFPKDAKNPNEVNKEIESPIAKNPAFPLVWRLLAKTPFIRRCFVVRTSGVRFGRKRKTYWGCCPECGLRLPREWSDGDIADKRIAIIGLKAAGKSCFLAELVDTLDRLQGQVGFSFVPFRTVRFNVKGNRVGYVDSNSLYQDQYGECINGVKVPELTAKAESNPQLRIPLIYRIVRGKKKVDLCLYDTAGEDVEKVENLHNNYYYATCASGVVFIVDPFSYPTLRHYCPGAQVAQGEGNPIHSLYRLYSENHKTVNLKMTIPCAVVFSKFDCFRKVPEFTPFLKADVSHNGGYNRERYKLIHKEMEKFFAKNEAPVTSNVLGQILSKYQLFAVSALGGESDPITGKPPQTPQKFGVAAPILWLLYEFGFIPESK